jgi:diaminopimelate decarboxylase
MFATNFLNSEQVHELTEQNQTPLYVYSGQKLRTHAKAMLGIPAPYGLTVRFAMKSNPYEPILGVFKDADIKIDASSGYEADQAIAAGYAPEDILLTSQQLAHNFEKLKKQGVQFNATSLRQLEAYGKAFPGTAVSVRINPGIGSGHSLKVNVGGPTSSFGIWHEYIPQLKKIADQYKLTIIRVHTHIGSGADPAVWQEVIRVSLEIVKNFPDATIINLGGGFKIARVAEEQEANMAEIGKKLAQELTHFYESTGRKLHLEVEPGTFLVANAGILLAKVDDIVDTGEDGYTFLKLNTGMNDILRPSLYGAQHPIAIMRESTETEDYVVVGHNCESGDLLSPAPGEPEVLRTRTLPKAEIGDIVLIGGAGAYCAAMSAKGYNSYPDAMELLI